MLSKAILLKLKQPPDQKKTNLHSLKTLHFSQVNAHPEFKALFQNIFREQQVRLLQQRYRKKLAERKWHEDEKRAPYKETLNGPLTLHFLKEPTGTKFQEHATHIKQGQWLNLDFQDPEFIRNIYKALRLNQITTNQLATALLLFAAVIEFKYETSSNSLQLHQYKFDEKGPYSPSTITYATTAQLDDFAKRLQQIPQNERCYFTINLHKIREVAFFYFGLDHAATLKSNFFITTFIKYIKKSNCSETEKNNLYSLIKNLPDRTLQNDLVKTLKDFIIKNEPHFLLFLQNKFDKTLHPNIQTFNKELDSSLFLSEIFMIDEQIPMLIISPDYNENEPHSPLLAFVILTTSALTQLQNAVHSEDESLNLHFTAGQFYPRLIRELDDRHPRYNQQKSSRPVELIHSDLIPNRTPHSYFADAFILCWHDLFHTWRSSSNKNKPLIRYLRNLLSSKGYDMSKNIYRLTDMDFNGTQQRLFEKTHGLKSNCTLAIIVNQLHFIFARSTRKFWSHTTEYDDNLFILIDMITNQNKWCEILPHQETPETLFASNRYDHNLGKLLDYTHFQKSYADIKKIINTFPNKSPIFYIMAYRLNHSKNISILCKFGEELNWNKIVYWTKNAGLHFKAGPPLEKLSAGEIEDRLLRTLLHYKTDLSSYHFTHIKTERLNLKNYQIKKAIFSPTNQLNIEPEKMILIQLQFFLKQQIQRLQNQLTEKGAAKKRSLYCDLLHDCREKMDNVVENKALLKNMLFRCATISHHRRKRTRNKCASFFLMYTGRPIKAFSWIAWQEWIAKLQSNENMKDHNPLLNDCLNKEKWLIEDKTGATVQGYDGNWKRQAYRTAQF